MFSKSSHHSRLLPLWVEPGWKRREGGLQLPLLAQSHLQGQPQRLNLALGEEFSSPTPLSRVMWGSLPKLPSLSTG